MNFIDNSSVNEETFLSVMVDTKSVLESWKQSLFAFEWINDGGEIKALHELPHGAKEKRAEVEELIRRGEPLQKPVLGIGLMEHVEIGSGKATLLTLAAQGVKAIPAHIPKSNQDEFEAFILENEFA